MRVQAKRDADFQPELRKNVVTREWVIIAKGRGRRPADLIRKTEETDRLPPHDDTCPFCTGKEAFTPPEVFALRDGGERDGAGWHVRVVPNKFAALRLEGSEDWRAVGIYALRDGLGAHEVVIESSMHNEDLWEMTPIQVEYVVEAYRQRLLHYESSGTLNHVLIFRNHGPLAGTSLVHPHSQLIAAPVSPHQLDLEMRGAAEYWEYLGRCVYCAMIEQERESKDRQILQTRHFLVVSAFAGRYPFETWILPKRHAICFADMSEDEASDFARVLRETLGKIGHGLGHPSYNFALHTAPAAEHNVRAYHWHLEIYPRITTLGGFELGSDIYINIIAPEDAADLLRDTKPPLP